jgi:hypothetical protein
MPAIDPLGSSRMIPAIVRTAAAIRSSSSVTRLARVVVVPCWRWNAIACLISSASSVVICAPPPPCMCTSTKPGSSHRRATSTTSEPLGGESPAPTPAMTPPSTVTQPGSSTRRGVTTWAFA